MGYRICNRKVLGCLVAEKSDLKSQEKMPLWRDKLANFEAKQQKFSEYVYSVLYNHAVRVMVSFGDGPAAAIQDLIQNDPQ